MVAKKRTLLLVISLLVLTACDQETAVPPTLPVEATSEIVVPTATETATPRPTLPRATLPPEPTDTPTPTATLPPPTLEEATLLPQIEGVEPLSVCESFAVDLANTMIEFPFGTSPTVRWTPVEGAVGYRVRIYNVRNSARELSDQPLFTDQTSYTFDAAFFQAGQSYGWDVYPVDAAQVQMCFPIGEALIPIG